MNKKIVFLIFAAVAARIVMAAVIPILDPTEGRYAQIAREMVATGDWVTPRLWVDGQHIPFLGKPPLFFWTAAMAIKVFGSIGFAVRLPSIVAAAALLFLMYRILRRYLGTGVAEPATLMTATSALLFVLSGSAVVDVHLTFFVSGALLAYLAFILEIDHRTQKFWSVVVFLLLAGGFMTKGPVALVLFGLPVLSWTALRRTWYLLRRHAWSVGVPLFLVLVVPWFTIAEIRNPGFLEYFFINENLLRFVSHDYGDLYGTGHLFPRGSAIAMFGVATLPWAPFGVWILFKRGRGWMQTMLQDDVQSLLFLGFGVNVAFWCCARQLLPTYMGPMVPIFMAWIAVNLRDLECAPYTQFKVALGATTIWFTLIISALPAASDDSTQAILREAHRVAWELNISDDVTFTHRASQSAFFYAPDSVLDHPKEPIHETIERVLESGDRRLLISRRSQAGLIAAEFSDRLLLVGRSDGWLLFLTRADDNARAD